MDKYAFGKLAGVGNGAIAVAHGTLSKSNIVDNLFDDFAKLRNNRVKTEECLLYIGATYNGYLDAAAFGRGVLTVGVWKGNGNWDGDLQTTCTMVKGAKIVDGGREGGQKAVRVNHDNGACTRFDVKKDQPVTITFFYKLAD